MNQKRFVNTAFVIIIVLLTGIVGFVAVRKQTSKTNVQQSQPTNEIHITQPPSAVSEYPFPSSTLEDETQKWKIYQNNQYGFTIKYPPEWIHTAYFSEQGGFFYIAFGLARTIDSEPLIVMRIYPHQTTLEKFMRYFIGSFEYYVKDDFKSTLVDNVPAKEVISLTQNSQPFILVVFVKEGYGYEFETTGFGEGEKTINTARKMLSTFKFIR